MLAVAGPTAAELSQKPEAFAGWEQAASLLVREAYEEFLRNDTLPTLEREFGLGLTLMNLQPRTQHNLRRAREHLEHVAAQTEAPDPLHALARFFRARLLEFYLLPPDAAAAEAEYEALLELRTGSPVIEMAASRLIMLAVFSGAPPERIHQRLEELEKKRGLLVTPAGLREFHTTMAYALLDTGGSRGRAVDHFLAADRQGFARMASALRLWCTAGDIAASIGRVEDARYFYTQALENLPRDPRAFTLRERLAALPPSLSPASSP